MSDEYVFETWEHAGCTIKIIADNDVEDPRQDFDYNTVMLCRYDRHMLGDQDHDLSWGEIDEQCGSWSEVGRFLEARHKVILKLPLYILDHSGLAMRTGKFAQDSAGWDTSVVGFIFHTEASLREQFCIPAGEPIPEETRTLALEGMEAEVKEYSSWLEGDCFGWVVEDKDGDTIESCWGYIGWDGEQKDYVIQEANNAAEHEEKAQRERNGAALMQRTLQEVM